MPIKIFGELTNQTGPAVIGREPFILPDQRKKAVEKVKKQTQSINY